MTFDALAEAQAARAELHKSTYWPAASQQKGTNHLWMTDVHLGNTIAALTVSTSPSGVPMPVGDIPGWRQIFADDFTVDVPLGQFPEAVKDKWFAYPYPWTGTPTWGVNDPHRTISVHDGLLDLFIHTDGTEHLIAAPVPRVAGPTAYIPGANPANFPAGTLYGRYAVRFKTDSFGYYKASWLLWPDSGVWPRDGEIDFPEANFDGNVAAFMHRQGGTTGGDQDAYQTSTPIAEGWHTAVLEWLPTRCTFLLDGVKVGESTSRIPSTPMHFVLQNGGRFDTAAAPATVRGRVLIDWVAVYAPAAA